jgi:hypothetical protein
MLLGHCYSSAGQQALNKDIAVQVIFKSQIENLRLGQKLIELLVLKDALMAAPMA